MNRREFFFTGAILFSGCTSYGNHKYSTNYHVQNLAEARYENYKLGETATIEIDKDSQTHTFPTGISRFIGLSIPQTHHSLTLETVTEYSGIYLPLASILVPRFAFLDSNFKLISSIEPIFHQNTGKIYESPIIRRAFYGACFVPPNTRHVIAYTDTSILETKPVRYLSPATPSGSSALEQARRIYLRTDKRDFAAGNIGELVYPQRGLAIFDIDRKSTGTIYLIIS